MRRHNPYGTVTQKDSYLSDFIDKSEEEMEQMLKDKEKRKKLWQAQNKQQ